MAMEANFFKECRTVNIGGGSFIIKNAPDSSQRTITHHHNNIVNDRSRRITNYGGYKNYGQHADGNGQINNYGPYTTNHGPVYGYRPNNPRYAGMNDWTPAFPDDDNVDDDFEPPLPARGQGYTYQQPDHFDPGDRDYYGRDPASQNEPQFSKKRTKAPRLSRTQTEQPSHATRGFDINSPQFKKEYESMSADMKAYVRGLGFDPQDSLNESMANVTLDDPGLRTSRSPESYGRRTPDVPPNVAHHPAYNEEYEEDEEEDEVDYDSTIRGQQQQYSSYTHNDNRVITKHINSHNVNNENTVDSFNDNSTRTNINKTAR